MSDNPYRTPACVEFYGDNQFARETRAADFDRAFAKLSANLAPVFAALDATKIAYNDMEAVAGDFSPEGIAKYEAAKAHYWSLIVPSKVAA